MRILLYTAIFFSFVSLSACNKTSDTDTGMNKSLVGRWLMIETLADPGDGSGKWTPVNASSKNDFLEFKEDGSIESQPNGSFVRVKQYKVTSDSTLNFILGSREKIPLYYQVAGSSLTITGGCIEACGSKFVKKIP